MPVYVDLAINPWRGKLWCHMYADTLDELHQFAAQLGLKRAWFQDKPTLKHYDLTESKRLQAIRMGAIAQSDRKEIVRTWAKCEGSSSIFARLEQQTLNDTGEIEQDA